MGRTVHSTAKGRGGRPADLCVLTLCDVVDLLVEQLGALVVDVGVGAVGAVRLGVELVEQLGEHLAQRGAWGMARRRAQ